MYEDLTPEKIKADILLSFETLDTREGSYINTLISPVAYKIWEYYQALNAVIPIAFVDETSGIYIDKRCADYGIERKQGTYATVKLLITGKDGTVIPIEKVFVTEDGLYFKTTEEVRINGETEVPAEALEVGEKYNVPAGAIIRQSVSLYGIDSVTNEEAHGGSDPESDEALVKRLYDFLRLPATSGNAYHYRHWAKETPGIGEAKVFPLHKGNGTVKVVVVDEDFKAVTEDEVLSNCIAHIEENRPIGATVEVVSATELIISVSADIKISGSTTQEIVEETFLKKIENYIKEVAFVSNELVYNKIGAMLMEIDGVLDYSNLIVNENTQSVTIENTQVPVMGKVEINIVT